MQISDGDSEATTGSIVTILDVSESSERAFSIFQLYIMIFAVVGFERTQVENSRWSEVKISDTV